jgi:hypothetical protein
VQGGKEKRKVVRLSSVRITTPSPLFFMRRSKAPGKGILGGVMFWEGSKAGKSVNSQINRVRNSQRGMETAEETVPCVSWCWKCVQASRREGCLGVGGPAIQSKDLR